VEDGPHVALWKGAGSFRNDFLNGKEVLSMMSPLTRSEGGKKKGSNNNNEVLSQDDAVSDAHVHRDGNEWITAEQAEFSPDQWGGIRRYRSASARFKHSTCINQGKVLVMKVKGTALHVGLAGEMYDPEKDGVTNGHTLGCWMDTGTCIVNNEMVLDGKRHYFYNLLKHHMPGRTTAADSLKHATSATVAKLALRGREEVPDRSVSTSSTASKVRGFSFVLLPLRSCSLASFPN
jgi:hypothetical protein